MMIRVTETPRTQKRVRTIGYLILAIVAVSVVNAGPASKRKAESIVLPEDWRIIQTIGGATFQPKDGFARTSGVHIAWLQDGRIAFLFLFPGHDLKFVSREIRLVAGEHGESRLIEFSGIRAKTDPLTWKEFTVEMPQFWIDDKHVPSIRAHFRWTGARFYIDDL